jgi:hypothetical protein
MVDVTAVAAIVVLVVGRDRHGLEVRPPLTPNAAPIDARAPAPDAVPDRPDVDARARQLAVALRAKDLDAAVRMLGVPLVHATCTFGRASDAPAVREVARCASTLPLVSDGYVGRIRHVKAADVITWVHTIADPRRDGRRRKTPAEAEAERMIVDALTAFADDHVFVAVEYISWPPERRYPGSGRSMELMFAVDALGRVDAIVPTDTATLD